MSNSVTLEKIVSLCKRRGFVYPSCEIYGGLNGIYDFGPLGVKLKNNLKKMWLTHCQSFAEDVVEFDGSLIGHPSMWKASGHIDNFSDPLVDCLECKRRFRADELNLEEPCPECKKKAWTEPRQFMLMFKTQMGAMTTGANDAYLRPETAQAIFASFKNIISSCRVKPPFGVAQIGKAFRNEITPKQFLFRVREFEQMELEFFCHPAESDKYFEIWIARRKAFYEKLQLKMENLRLREHAADELAHYSKACRDFEYKFPFGWKELEGIAHRGAFDLTQHQNASNKDLSFFDQTKQEKFIPEVVECSVGVDRLFTTVLFDAYEEEELPDGPRIVLHLAPALAPIKVAVLPLVNKLEETAEKIYQDLKQKIQDIDFDRSGSIGKRYRRQDEIGTPFCVTVDFESLEDGCVTVRDRDTLKQERITLCSLVSFLQNALNR